MVWGRAWHVPFLLMERKMDFVQKVERYIKEQQILLPGMGAIVACSGGADSMALLELFRRWRSLLRLRICVAHFEHGIRGEDSLADACFVEAYCKKHDLQYVQESADVLRLSKERGLSLETMARELRYDFFERQRNLLGFDVIATAHHADDQAETVLMRILRGTGMEGLAAMRPKNGCIVRPLLCARKSELEAFCREQGIEPRHDATNDIADCQRNRLRLKLLPQLSAQYNPQITEALCRLSVLAAEMTEQLALDLEAAWENVCVGKCLSVKEFSSCSTILQREILRKFLRECGIGCKDFGFVHFEAMRDLILRGRTGTVVQLPGKVTGRVSYGWFSLVQECREGEQVQEVLLTVPGITELPAFGFSLVAEYISFVPKHTEANEYYCDGEQVRRLFVRARQAGDRIQLRGGGKSLKKLLIDEKIPRERRNSLPVVTDGEHVLWVPGVRRSVLCSVGQASGKILYLRIMQRNGVAYDAGE